MPNHGEMKLTNETADELKRRAKEAYKKEKRRTERYREFLERRTEIPASSYYNAIEPRPMMRTTLDPVLKAFGFNPDDGSLYEFDYTRMHTQIIYTITNTRPPVPVKVNVCFEPLTTDDTKTIQGEDWQTARFYDAWIDTAQHEAGWKLTLCEGEDKPILGLIRLGTAPPLNGDKGALSGSLLESIPVHQHGTAQRGYKGIGRVLIARLVEESKAQGADGSVRVRPVQGTVPFYERLGFRPSRIPPYYRLDAQDAEILLRACQEK